MSWLERLDAERDNLRAALTWATEEDEADIGLRIGTALWRYWQLRGSDSEGRERLERLLALRSGSEEARGLALKQDRLACVREGRSRGGPSLRRTRACRYFAGWETTGSQARSASWPVPPWRWGPRPCARPRRGGARGRAALGDEMTESYAHYCAGVVYAWRGELDEAERLLEVSVRGARRLGNLRSVASWTRALGGDCARSPRLRASMPPLRGEPRTAPHARRPLGHLPRPLEPRPRVRRGARLRSRAAPSCRERRPGAEDRRLARPCLQPRSLRKTCRRATSPRTSRPSLRLRRTHSADPSAPTHLRSSGPTPRPPSSGSGPH